MKFNKKIYFIKLSITILFVFILTSCIKNNINTSINNKEYTYEQEVIKSSVDFNSNGIDDYTDFLNGAKKDAKNMPKYDGSYIQGGYPNDNRGVCTDVIWRAFKEAGYSLKDMIDMDISKHISDYTQIDVQDPNIDFRRVKNLHTFFYKYAISLSTDIKKSDEWNAGDIVIFKDDYHIGIISNIRSKDGIPYVIHNMGQNEREENFMQTPDILGKRTPIAHFRFDSSLIDESVLKKWEN